MKPIYYTKNDINDNVNNEEVINVIREIITDFPDYYPILIKGEINLDDFEGMDYKIGFSTLLVDSQLLNDIEIKKYKKFESSFSVEMSNCRNRGNDTTNFRLFITKDLTSYQNFLKLIAKNNNTTISSVGLKPVNPYYNIENVILNNEIREDLNSAISLIKNQEKIYNVWGFSKIDKKPKLILNFYGPPGTGKTMTAHSIANVFDKKILLVNYSDIESKYVGDAPKNLDEVFKIAEANNAVLFFDEADSFLGKRISDVSSSSDQAINSLRSQMLILLEEFNGIVIFATNMVKNYDKAFESRILKHIKFELPNEKERSKIIKSMLSISAPIERRVFEEESIKKLAKISDGFSGRIIKNAVLNSLVKAASLNLNDNSEIGLAYFIDGFNETKLRIQNLKKETESKRIPNQLRTQIENKIKENLNKEKNVS